MHKVSGKEYLPKTAMAGCTIGLWKNEQQRNHQYVRGTRLEVPILDQLGNVAHGGETVFQCK